MTDIVGVEGAGSFTLLLGSFVGVWAEDWVSTIEIIQRDVHEPSSPSS